MLNFFRYNKSKRNIINFFDEYEGSCVITEKHKGILKIEFSRISKVDLIKVSNRLINTLGIVIYDLEIVFCNNSKMSIGNQILVGLKSKLPIKFNLVSTGVNYQNLIEYKVTQKYGVMHKELDGLVLASNIGNYYILKMKVK